MKKMFIQMFSGKDNASVDMGRVLWFESIQAFIFITAYWVFKGGAFEPIAWGAGLASLLAGGGAAIGLKASTEPGGIPTAARFPYPTPPIPGQTMVPGQAIVGQMAGQVPGWNPMNPMNPMNVPGQQAPGQVPGQMPVQQAPAQQTVQQTMQSPVTVVIQPDQPVAGNPYADDDFPQVITKKDRDAGK